MTTVAMNEGSPDSTENGSRFVFRESFKWSRSLSERVKGMKDTAISMVWKNHRLFKLAEIEALEACDWLREAGFPQYAQMYEDHQFPIDVSSVARDHEFLSEYYLESVFKRLRTLNKCASMKIEAPTRKNTDESDEEDLCALSDKWRYQRSSRRWSRKDIDLESQNTEDNANNSVEKSPILSCSSRDSVLTDNEENVSQNNDSPVLKSDKPNRDDLVLTEIPPPDGEGKDSPQNGNYLYYAEAADEVDSNGALSPSLRRAASEKFRGAKNFLTRMQSLKGSKKTKRSKMSPNGKLEISDPVVRDTEGMQERMNRLGCVDISPTSENATDKLPNGGSPRPFGSVSDSDTSSQKASPIVTAKSYLDNSGAGVSDSDSLSSAAQSPALPPRLSHSSVQDIDNVTPTEVTPVGAAKLTPDNDTEHSKLTDEDLQNKNNCTHVSPRSEKHKRGRKGTRADLLSMKENRLSFYDNVPPLGPDVDPQKELDLILNEMLKFTESFNEISSTLELQYEDDNLSSSKDNIPSDTKTVEDDKTSDNVVPSETNSSNKDSDESLKNQKEDIFSVEKARYLCEDDRVVCDNIGEEIEEEEEEEDPVTRVLRELTMGTMTHSPVQGVKDGLAASARPSNIPQLPAAAAIEDQDSPVDNEAENGSGGSSSSSRQESEGEAESREEDGSDQGEGRERRDSGVGSSLTRAPSDRRRHRIRWHSFVKSHRPSFNSRNLQINNMSAGQLNVLKKLCVLKITAIMDKYSPSSHSGRHWIMPKLKIRFKTPDYKDKNVFGVPPIVVQQRSGQPLPQSILFAMRYLRRTAMDAVGIFRKPGARSRIQRLREEIEDNPEFTDFESLQPYDVADLIKQYFRELPECLLTTKYSEYFMSIFTHVPQELRQEALQSTIMLLPDENREVLQSLLFFLSDMAQHSRENQMTASNLAVCFAPSLFHMCGSKSGSATSSPKRERKNPGTPDQRELRDQKAAHECLTEMIKECKKIFMIPEEMVSKCRFSYIEQGDPVSLDELGKRRSNEESADYTAYVETCIQGILKESRDKFKGWVSRSTPCNIDLAFKKVGDGHPLRLWKSSVEVEAPPVEVLNRIMRERHLWDEDFSEFRLVEKLDPNTEIFQYVLNSMAPHPTRDFCELRSWRTDLAKGACVLVSTSVEHHDGKLLGGIRGVTLASRHLIEPCGSGKSRLTHICRIDIRGHTPDWYSNVYGHICAKYTASIRDSFNQAITKTGGPETKI